MRPLVASAEQRQALAADLGLPGFAATFPMARVDIFRRVLEAYRSGGFTKIPKPRSREVLKRRFGLDALDPRDLRRVPAAPPAYRTLLEVGAELGVTRERVRQLEEQGLKALGAEE